MEMNQSLKTSARGKVISSGRKEYQSHSRKMKVDKSFEHQKLREKESATVLPRRTLRQHVDKRQGSNLTSKQRARP